MKLASKLKLDQQPCPPSVASHLLHQVDQFLKASDKMSHPAALEDLNVLARKLDNPKLLDQCKVNKTKSPCRTLKFLYSSKTSCWLIKSFFVALSPWSILDRVMVSTPPQPSDHPVVSFTQLFIWFAFKHIQHKLTAPWQAYLHDRKIE